MEINKLNKNKILLDGQTIYFIDQYIINELRTDPIIDNIRVGPADIIKTMEKKVIFASRQLDFEFGLFKLEYPKKSNWLGELLYKYQGNWYRVRMENCKCKNCGEIWSIANPTEYSLFDFVKNKEFVYNKAKNLKRLTCPKCNGELDRHAIWIEEKETLTN